MNRLIIVTMLSLVSACALAQPASDLVEEGFRGRVKTVTETQYINGQKQAAARTVDQYNLNGYLVEEVQNDYVLQLNTRKRIKYDTTSSGLITCRSEFDDSGVVRVVAYTRDSLSRITAIADQRTIGGRKVVYKTEYYYDSAGRCAREMNYTDSLLNFISANSYDRHGRLSRVRARDKRDTTVSLSDYNYVTTSTQWANFEKLSDGVRSHIFRMIDTAGVILEKTSYIDDYSQQKTETFSDFDKYGNWQRQNVKEVSTDKYYVIRKIEYYK